MKKLFLQFKTEVYVLAGLFVAWKLWPIISPVVSLASTVTETAAAAAAGATANIQVSSQLAVDKAALRSLYPGVTEVQITGLRADARAFAGLLGTLSGKWSFATFLPEMGLAFSLLKNKYSRLHLVNNKPQDRVTGHLTNFETPASLKNVHNYSVLQPFYAEYTAGASLKADLQRLVFVKTIYAPYAKWIL